MSGAMQKSSDRIERGHTDRVKITYDIELGDTVEQREVPFVLGVVADLSGHPEKPLPRLRYRKFLEINIDNFDNVLAKIAPRVSFAVPNRLVNDGSRLIVDLRFRSIQEFGPGEIAEQVPALDSLLAARGNLDNLRSAVHANDRLDAALREILLSRSGEKWEPPADKIDKLLQSGLLGVLEEEKMAAREFLKTFFDLCCSVSSHDMEAILTARISALDDLLSHQVSEVLHHPELQRLEASWRGLEYLVMQTRSSQMLKLRVLDVSKRELFKDLQKAPEFDQSALFRLACEEEYGVFGGSPFSALICDFEFGPSKEDVWFLESLSYIAEAAAAPVMAGANPGMFNLESFTELSGPRDLAKIFDSITYISWKRFRDSDSSRFVGLVLPRILMRRPYGRQGISVEGFNYDEGVDGTEHEKFLWGNAVWAFAARLTDAFDRFGWCAAISGMERGGVVRDLPTYTFVSDEGEAVAQWPTEIAITDRRRTELEHLGFIPLCHEKETDRAVFFAARSCQRRRIYDRDVRNCYAREAIELENTFAAARFVHYIRCIMRDKIGSFDSNESATRFLNSWIANYVCLDDFASANSRANFPLREARIDVLWEPHRLGRLCAKVSLKPLFQVPELSAALEFVVALPSRSR